jgi:3-hydroxybutyryl-CoA dehydrogenase
MHVACLGAGVIGASWTALFLATGHTVAIHDPQTGAEDHVRRYVETA